MGRMRKVILFALLISLSLVYESVAEKGNLCDTCSLIDEDYIALSSDKVHTPQEITDTISPASPARIIKTETDTGSEELQKNNNSDFVDVLFRSQINRLDEILHQYKNNEDGIFANTRNIDLLSEFRRGENGQDVIVPLGFFLYLNKKF